MREHAYKDYVFYRFICCTCYVCSCTRWLCRGSSLCCRTPASICFRQRSSLRRARSIWRYWWRWTGTCACVGRTTLRADAVWRRHACTSSLWPCCRSSTTCRASLSSMSFSDRYVTALYSVSGANRSQVMVVILLQLHAQSAYLKASMEELTLVHICQSDDENKKCTFYNYIRAFILSLLNK